MSDKPKTQQLTINAKDRHKDTFAAEKVGGLMVTYLSRRGYRYGYYGSSSDRIIRLDGDTIVGTTSGTVTLEAAETYLTWVRKNCSWHKTEVRPASTPNITLGATDFTIPTPQITKVYITSTVHRTMTPTQVEDLAKVRVNKTERLAAQKKKTRELRAQWAAEERKREKEHKDREVATAANAEFGDLAAALKTLKKHGLKIITVEEKS